MTKTCLCDMCRFANIRTERFMKPRFKFSKDFIEGNRLVVYCDCEGNFKRKLILKCSFYKPRAGKIGKKLYQKTL